MSTPVHDPDTPEALEEEVINPDNGNDNDHSDTEIVMPEDTPLAQTLDFQVEATAALLTSSARDVEFDDQDLKMLYKAMHNVDQCWAIATNIDDVCKLAITSIKLIECRRSVKGLDRKPGKGGSGGWLLPM